MKVFIKLLATIKIRFFKREPVHHYFIMDGSLKNIDLANSLWFNDATISLLIKILVQHKSLFYGTNTVFTSEKIDHTAFDQSNITVINCKASRVDLLGLNIWYT